MNRSVSLGPWSSGSERSSSIEVKGAAEQVNTQECRLWVWVIVLALTLDSAIFLCYKFYTSLIIFDHVFSLAEHLLHVESWIKCAKYIYYVEKQMHHQCHHHYCKNWKMNLTKECIKKTIYTLESCTIVLVIKIESNLL